MMLDVPPRPTPFPLPSKAPSFWGFGQCQGCGWVGARAGLVLGMITPPLPPFPYAFFFRGGTRGRGVEGGLAMPWSSPPPPPPVHPVAMHAPGAARLSWIDRWGKRQVQGTNAHPTTQKLDLKTPNNATPPPLVLLAGLHHKKWAENTARQDGWGKGLGGV